MEGIKSCFCVAELVEVEGSKFKRYHCIRMFMTAQQAEDHIEKVLSITDDNYDTNKYAVVRRTEYEDC